MSGTVILTLTGIITAGILLALVYALLTFMGLVAIARYLERGI
jgi:multisubunit Na+/H+ antiporter MnhF subunit